jgi:hypothetical protein
MPESLPLAAVLLPRITGRAETALDPASAREVEWALSTGTLVHLPHVGVQTVGFLSRMARAVPHATLQLGTDREGIVAAIRQAAVQPLPKPRADSEDRPFVSLAAALWGEQVDTWPAMLANLEQQDYPRVEVLVVTDRPTQIVESQRVHIQVLNFERRVSQGTAWNRSLREAFAEWVVLLEPGDRLRPGALATWMESAREQKEAEWIAAGNRWMVRRDAPLRHGWFDVRLERDEREAELWAQGSQGVTLDRTLVDAAPPMEKQPLFERSDLRVLKDALDFRRKQASRMNAQD